LQAPPVVLVAEDIEPVVFRLAAAPQIKVSQAVRVSLFPELTRLGVVVVLLKLEKTAVHQNLVMAATVCSQPLQGRAFSAVVAVLAVFKRQAQLLEVLVVLAVAVVSIRMEHQTQVAVEVVAKGT
jgi:hypothetical protein